MPWTVEFDAEFLSEFRGFDAAVRKAIAAYAVALESEGPQLGRPMADTLKGSKHPNMKELRPTVNRVEWRVAYAFDTARKAILLAAAAKGGRVVGFGLQEDDRPGGRPIHAPSSRPGCAKAIRQ